MQKVLTICGPTAVGKTSVALELAKKTHADILVADSRQVYKGMDIVTGKDIPKLSSFQFPVASLERLGIGCWETNEGVRIWLTDLVNPKNDFSVALWHKAALKVLNLLKKEKSLPIVVGGTGLYIKSLSGEIETIGVPPNKSLRSSLSTKTKEELFEILAQLNSVKAASLNNSDKNNPYRLIRAIEIADFGFVSGKNQLKTSKSPSRKKEKFDILKIGLTTNREELFKRIELRVNSRLESGAIEETEKLLSNGLARQEKPMTVFGYKQLADYLSGKITKESAIKKWKIEEYKYAVRQLTWFKKDHEIIWFDINDVDWVQKLEKIVQNWYNMDEK